MKIEAQVCTFEQSKKLKELGINNKSTFNYWDFNNVSDKFFHSGRQHLVYGEHCPASGSINNELKECWFPAFTVAELGVMLPNGYDTMQNSVDGWRGYNDDNSDCPPDNEGFATEAEARAAMLIYLLENNLTTAEEVNQRLTTP